MKIDVRAHNRAAWNQLVKNQDRWTQPIGADQISEARSGKLNVVLTPTKTVPTDWFPKLAGLRTLCLAGAGGQQAPLLAAAGASVTVLDNSPSQLAQDRFVAGREGLTLETIEGDMADLSRFPDETFGLIVHPCSNMFVPDVCQIWKECFRVIRPGGVLLAGFTNPARYLFDDERKENGRLDVRYSLPYSDLDHLDDPEIRSIIDSGKPIEFGHTLEDQIGGQLRSGFVLTGFFEDCYSDTDKDPLSKYMSTFIATRSIRPSESQFV